MAEQGGTFLGRLPLGHPLLDPLGPVARVVDPALYGMTPEQWMQQEEKGMFGYQFPGDSRTLWIYKDEPKEEKPSTVPMSYLDPETANG